MNNKDLKFYEHAFTHLHRDHQKGGAPHKPILLLSILDAFENNLISDNKIYITPELIGFFNINWAHYVEDGREKRFALPFYHMKTEKFWLLEPNEGCEIWVQSKDSMRNLGSLQTAVKYAIIDLELYEILKNKVKRDTLREIIIENYFPNCTKKVNYTAGLKLVENIENQIVNESAAEYFTTIKELKAKLRKEEFEEEIILRGSVFKREVPQKYKYTCCVSGLRVNVSFNSTILIEACHIEPFSHSYIDVISNGIALSPTLHKAFDRGLFTFSKDYEIIVSQKFTESDSKHGLQQFHGKRILLPDLEKHYPDIDRINWHKKHKFEK